MARLNKSTRRRILNQIPPKKCKARSKTRGNAVCDHWAMVGSDVCRMHGGMAPQVKAIAEARITLAERLKTAPKRHTWEVLEDTAHIADVLMQDARLAIEQGTFTLAQLDKLITAVDRAHRLSTSNHHAGLAERRQRFAEGQAEQMHKVFARILTHPDLGLTQEQKALVPRLIKSEIEGVLVKQGEIAA